VASSVFWGIWGLLADEQQGTGDWVWGTGPTQKNSPR